MSDMTNQSGGIDIDSDRVDAYWVNGRTLEKAYALW